MTSNGDNCSSPVRTRGQWRRESKGDLEDYYQSKYEKEDVPTETKELVQDQIFHSFVEKVVNPNEGPIKEEANDSVVYLPPTEEEVQESDEDEEDEDSGDEDLDQEIADLTNLVEDMVIPTDDVPASAAAVEVDGSEDSDSDDEDKPDDVSVSEITQEEMISDDEGEEYKPPVEADPESSDDSYESATSGSDTDDQEADAKMDE